MSGDFELGIVIWLMAILDALLGLLLWPWWLIGGVR
jgi:hypothetical protein